MSAPTSLLDWILSLLRDPDARAAFQSDPDRYATLHGFQDLSSADVHDALCLIADNASASYDHSFSARPASYYPPPGHHQPHQTASHYLNHYITNYTTVVEQRTNIDTSIHQNVDTHGGSFAQVVDNDPVVASGHGAVAAGGDFYNNTVTSGSGSVVGDGNHAVTGSGGVSSFGSGDAGDARLDDVGFGDGGAFSSGGAAHGHVDDNRTTTHGHATDAGETSVTAAGSHGHAAQYADQSAHDTSSHEHYTDDSRTDENHTYNSHNTDNYADTHDTDTHLG